LLPDLTQEGVGSDAPEVAGSSSTEKGDSSERGKVGAKCPRSRLLRVGNVITLRVVPLEVLVVVVVVEVVVVVVVVDVLVLLLTGVGEGSA
jgi:hypothetical protein